MISIVLQTISSFVLLVISKIGYAGIFFLMFLQSVNIPIPSEITMPFSGFLAQQGTFNFWLVVIMGALGNLAGALLSYYLAYYLAFGKSGEKGRVLKILISDGNLELAGNWFKKYGTFSVFFSRMIPVVSTFISFPAGLSKMKISTFTYLTLAGSFIWCLFLTWLGYILGANWQTIEVYFRKFDYVILALAVLIFLWWLYNHIKPAKK